MSFTHTTRCFVYTRLIKINGALSRLVSRSSTLVDLKSTNSHTENVNIYGVKRNLIYKSINNKDLIMVHSKAGSFLEQPKVNLVSANATVDRMFHCATKSNTSASKMAQLIDGKQIAREIQEELRKKIETWKAQGHRSPQLTAILIGDDPASTTYVNNKMKAAADVGIESKTERFGTEITEEQLLERIDQLNNDDAVDGILIQLPVPNHIDERKVCNAVSCDKDVDGFNERNIGRLCLDMNTLIPCTPLGVQELIKRTGIETFGKNAVVVGRSKNVGMPIAMLLHADGRNDTCAMDCTVTICHRFTPPQELKRFCRTADIIVTATGVPGLITSDMIKEGAAIIDVGITRITDPSTGKKKLVGDVDFEEVRKKAGLITPVPGGVGPMTVAMLMKNTIIAAKNLAKKRNES
uniref:methenyltetrahydrofolate cyclohydrolase n=1 Tax=Anopheles coluzzii TaxID=1518534 RepID=A0A6E8VJV1_ANOCL|nr:bifunctional methylenetetrahydrofolate dehydrogenase/cyclohydrolase, mitochondrial isoform X1 [Anopheles coluzzii]XP_040228693.2 bifunctional methylenetetrahydrofolate dehydrogenase/cyclohydrolase, mitochondrial isoform X1 [Anopheles coluzzii]